LVLAVLCAADFLVVLDGLIVAVALPTMQHALGIAPASLQWVVNAYVLCFGGFLAVGAGWVTCTAAAASSWSGWRCSPPVP
jgi:MFS family permease